MDFEEKCLFCKIGKKEIASEVIYENKEILGFKDLNPVAPIHYLFIHKQHTKNINDLVNTSPDSLLSLFKGITDFTQSTDLAEKGFRLITNIGDDGGQSVFHTHIHLLGGAKLPMGIGTH